MRSWPDLSSWFDSSRSGGPLLCLSGPSRLGSAALSASHWAARSGIPCLWADCSGIDIGFPGPQAQLHARLGEPSAARLERPLPAFLLPGFTRAHASLFRHPPTPLSEEGWRRLAAASSSLWREGFYPGELLSQIADDESWMAQREASVLEALCWLDPSWRSGQPLTSEGFESLARARLPLERALIALSDYCGSSDRMLTPIEGSLPFLRLAGPRALRAPHDWSGARSLVALAIGWALGLPRLTPDQLAGPARAVLALLDGPLPSDLSWLIAEMGSRGVLLIVETEFLSHADELSGGGSRLASFFPRALISAESLFENVARELHARYEPPPSGSALAVWERGRADLRWL